MMHTKNAKRITQAERAHMERVKSLPCSVCDAPGPSEAHHIRQGDHFTCIAVCPECHRGRAGIHGDQSMLRLRYRIGGTAGELAALNETLRRMAQ